MYSYSGKYRLDKDRFITKVDIAGDLKRVGTEQQWIYRVNGDTLIIESAPATQRERRYGVFWSGKESLRSSSSGGLFSRLSYSIPATQPGSFLLKPRAR